VVKRIMFRKLTGWTKRKHINCATQSQTPDRSREHKEKRTKSMVAYAVPREKRISLW